MPEAQPKLIRVIAILSLDHGGQTLGLIESEYAPEVDDELELENAKGKWVVKRSEFLGAIPTLSEKGEPVCHGAAGMFRIHVEKVEP